METSEIEVKAKINNIDEIISKLKSMGCSFSEPVVQNDFVFNQKGVDIKDHSHGSPVLRIRKQGDRTIFTLKKNRANELDCLEKEIDVSDGNILKDIIELLGFELTVNIRKTRRKSNYQDYEICLDEVDGLGSFIEVEKISSEDGKKVQDELFSFLKELGVKEGDRVLFGYDTQLLLKKSG